MSQVPYGLLYAARRNIVEIVFTRKLHNKHLKESNMHARTIEFVLDTVCLFLTKALKVSVLPAISRIRDTGIFLVLVLSLD